MPIANYLFALLLAYLAGAIPTAYVVGHMHKIDITRHGSGNVGGTNAFRVIGKGPGILVMAFDILKSAIPTYLAMHIQGIAPWQLLTIAAATVIGHNWSIYIGLRGGKGIACTIGVAAVLFPMVLAMALAVALLSVAITKYVSFGSLLFTALLPPLLWWQGYTAQYLWFSAFLMVLAWYRHRSNIDRLLKGTETKIVKTAST